MNPAIPDIASSPTIAITISDETWGYCHKTNTDGFAVTLVYDPEGETRFYLPLNAERKLVEAVICGYLSGWRRGKEVGQEDARHDMRKALGLDS